MNFAFFYFSFLTFQVILNPLVTANNAYKNIDGIFLPRQVCLGNEVFDMAEANQSYGFKKMKQLYAV